MRSTIENIILPLLIVLLFAYTGTAKLIDQELMVRQLTFLGFPSGWGKFFSITVPVAEIIVALLIVLNKYRVYGLALATILMFVFTIYVAAILAGTTLPCSCGGVLQSMSWQQHLFFNLFFFLLSGWSFRQHYNELYRYREVSRKPRE